MTDFLDDLRLARRGDRAALGRLLTRNEERLRGLAQRRLGQELRFRMHASDVLQSTYLAVLKYIDDFEGDSENAFAGWLVKIFENNVRDKARYFDVRARHGEVITPDSPEADDSEAGPYTRAALGDDFRRFAKVVDLLPEDHRKILLLRLVEKKSYEEIAEVLGRTPKACRILFPRVRAELTLLCERMWREDEDHPKE